jgi:hypothetical protein
MHDGHLMSELGAHNGLSNHGVMGMNIKIPSMLALSPPTAHASMLVQVLQLSLPKGHAVIIFNRLDPLPKVYGARQPSLLHRSVIR